MLRLSLSLALVVTALPAAALAQSESGAGLTAPTAPSGQRPTSTPPATQASPELPDTGVPPADVPPPPGAVPPPSGFEPGEARYPTATTADLGRTARGDGDLRIPSRLATRLRVLDADLTALATRSGNGVVNGVLSMTSGVLSFVLGFYVENPFDVYLWLWGGAAVVSGIADIALNPDASGPAVAFGHMPMTTMRQVEERLAFGEDALSSLARRSRTARILDASINIAVGVAVVPVLLAPNDFEFSSPLDYFVLIGSGISVISGLIALATRSEAERRHAAYSELRERLEREERERGARAGADADDLEAELRALAPEPSPLVRVAAAPVPGGAGVAASVAF